MPPQSRLSAFLAELKRRRVFRVAAVYGGVAFVLFQIIDSIFEPLHIPEWTGSLIIILLLVGFPLAVGLAWVFDITPEGIVRTGKAGGAGIPPSPSKAGAGSGKPLTSNRALIVIAVLAVAFGVWSRWGGRAKDGPLTLAVLPFQHYSAEGGDWFADGFTDELISQLSKLSDIMVIARTTTMHYKKTALSAGDIGAELGVDLALEGSILRADGKVRITGQLIDTQTGGHVWSESYQRPLEDAIALQADVAFSIAQALKEELTPAEARDMAALPTSHPVAYDHYLRALSIINDLDLHPIADRDSSVARRDEAIDELERALVLDPAFAKAHYEVVRAHGLLYIRKRGQDRSAERLAKMDRALARAEISAPGTVPVKMAKGLAYNLGRVDYGQALGVFEPLHKQHPGDPEIMRHLGRTYRRVGRWDEALDLLVQAADLNPRDAQATLVVLDTYRRLHRYEEARRYFERLKYLGATERYATRAWIAVEGYGDLDEAWSILEAGYEELGSGPLDEALLGIAAYRRDYEWMNAFLKNATGLSPVSSLLWLARINRFQGDAEGMVRHAMQARDAYREQEGPNYSRYRSMAFASAIMGDREQTLAWGEKALELMNPSLDAVAGPFHYGIIGAYYFAVGELDRGFDLLETAFGYPMNITVNDMPYHWLFDDVRTHPRYLALIDKYGGGR